MVALPTQKFGRLKKKILNACKADVIEGWRVRENQEIFLHVWLDSKL